MRSQPKAKIPEINEPKLLHGVLKLWRASPNGFRRALQSTGIPYVVGFVARYAQTHGEARFAGYVNDLKVEYSLARADERPALSARFDGIMDSLVMPNAVTKTTYAGRQAQVLRQLLAHDGCALDRATIRVLDVPSSAGTASLSMYSMLSERYRIASYVMGDLYFDLVYDPVRGCVFDQEGALLEVKLSRGFFSIYRAKVSGDVHSWLSSLFLLPFDRYASYLRKQYPYTDNGQNIRIRLLHPEVEAMVRDGVFGVARIDVFDEIPGAYDVILSFNLLQRNYFPPNRLALGVENLGRSLDEGGLMVLGDTESFAAFRKRDAQMVLVVQEGRF